MKEMNNEVSNNNDALREEYQQIIKESEADRNIEVFDRILPLAEAGLAEAQCYIGRYYKYDKPREKGYKEQVEHWLRLSAEQHYPPAELELGEWLYYGRNTFKTDAECEQWFLLAAEHEQAEACYFLGKLAKDRGDMAEACRWWLKGAEAGDGNSQEELAFCYETAQGVPYDIDAAIHWYKQVALHDYFGPEDAFYQIAVLKKYAMEKFANLNDWASERFWEGEKEMLRGNLAKAVSLWRWTPDPRAMVMEAWQMLHVVDGVVEKEGEEYFDDDEMFVEEEEESIKAVAKLFSKHKHPAAYYLMGFLYEYNICYIKKDMTQARYWYGKAAEAGDPVAVSKLKKLEKDMMDYSME